jgi:hypothetical protein
MSLTRPPLTLIQPIGKNEPGSPVKSDGTRLLVADKDVLADDVMLDHGNFDDITGVLTLYFASGRKINIGGFATRSNIGEGKPGIAGRDGIDGVPGQPGAPGKVGVRGWAGSQGLRGEPGNQGYEGPTGISGPSGADGAAGADGECCPANAPV